MATTTIDVSAVARGERLDFWCSAVCDQFVTLDVVPSDGDRMHGQVVASSVGDVRLRGIGASAHRFERTPGLIRGADEDYYQIALARRGSTLVTQDGRETIIRPGEFVLYDSSRPFTFVTDDDFEYVVCLFPKRLIPLPAADLAAATAVRFNGRHGIGAMIPPLLSAMRRLGDDLNEATEIAITQTVGDLLVAVVTSEIPSAAPDNVHLERAQAHIAEHISDRRLSPQSVAAACAISSSYLHKLFRESGTTVTAYIREQRLQGCWRDLRAPRYAGLTVTAIGARWGLPDPAHLSRLFRARFGISPSEHRLQNSGMVVRPP
ncbi:AraC-like ligand-binding domain-containing protein [Pseudonocardia asaccharolytica]|uniref:AraC-like ligand-binding domain-containing protein n=1 Tax=Pseudonocardia asaccharolytica TaxID=54010 RepID=UPI00048FEB1E|nr:helix-turn-helix domain-containing protein [Pseudonocardia asaccharolytica]